jgi:hypothetical protein
MLELDNNAIEKLPSPGVLSRYPSLFALTLSKNKVANLSPYASSAVKHDRLELLDLADNEVSSLVGLKHFPALKILQLRGNRVMRVDGLVDGLVACCPNLSRLDLSYNALEGLKEVKRLAALTRLEHLSVVGNEAIHYEVANGPQPPQPALGSAVDSAARAGADGAASEAGDGGVGSDRGNGSSRRAPAPAAAPAVAPKPAAYGTYSVDDAFVMEVLICLPQLLSVDGVAVAVKQRKQADGLNKERVAEAARVAEEEKKRLEEERLANADLDNPDGIGAAGPGGAVDGDGRPMTAGTAVSDGAGAGLAADGGAADQSADLGGGSMDGGAPADDGNG